LKRDPRDIRINKAYGSLLLRTGLFQDSEAYFRKLIKSSIRHSPNPYHSESYYNLGLTLKFQGRLEEAEKFALETIQFDIADFGALAQAANPNYCFSNQLFDMIVLSDSIDKSSIDARAHYYLGNLMYDKKRHQEAIALWESSILLDPITQQRSVILRLLITIRIRMQLKRVLFLREQYSLDLPPRFGYN